VWLCHQEHSASWTMAGEDKVTQRRSILTVLGKAPPKPMIIGLGTAQRKQHLGSNGRLPAWYHSYWRPVDSEKNPGQLVESCDLRRKLLEDNARMLCMPCYCSRTRTSQLSWDTTQPPTSKTVFSVIAQLLRTAQRGRRLRL
jgi:hypothetical protein